MRTSRWTIFLYCIVIVFGLITALPNLFTQQQLAQLPSWIPKQQVTLGLDLKGGSYVAFEVDGADLLRERLQDLADGVANALQDAKIATSAVRTGNGNVAITLKDPAQRADALRVLQGLAQP